MARLRVSCSCVALPCLLLALAAIAFLSSGQPAAANCGQPLIANIGWSTVGPDGPWSTADCTMSAGTIYFHAMSPDPDAQPLGTEIDWDAGGVQDHPKYIWDFNFQPGDPACTKDCPGPNGLAAAKSYSKPGNRVVRLCVDDLNDVPDYEDDLPAVDFITVQVKLTIEWDSMTGVQGMCTAEQHEIYDANLSARWAAANYTLSLNRDNRNCQHHQFIRDDMDDPQIYAWLDVYENCGCHLYLMGGHQYSNNLDRPGGTWWPVGNQVHALSMVFAFYRGGMSEWDNTTTALHENACHDGSVGAIGHCTTANLCACKDPGSRDAFCDSGPNNCVARLKAAQQLEQ